MYALISSWYQLGAKLLERQVIECEAVRAVIGQDLLQRNEPSQLRRPSIRTSSARVKFNPSVLVA